MPHQANPAPTPNQSDRPAEEIMLDLVRSGELSIDEGGRIWRHRVRRGRLSESCIPRRAEYRTPLGYFQLRAMVDWRRYHVGAHRVVWWNANGPIPAGYVINHLNGQKWDNRPGNLECVTPSRNSIHAHRTGLRDQRGERNPAAKLSDHQIAEIRLAYSAGGVTMFDLADRYGVRFQHISRLVRGERRATQPGPVSPADHRYCPCDRDPASGRFLGKEAAVGHQD